jgi:hypothetical protein
MDEEKIDIEDLKDRILFGNSFNNTALLLERKHNLDNLVKNGFYKTNYSNKTSGNYLTKESRNSNKNGNFLGVKRRKMINSSGVRVINSLYSLSSVSINKRNLNNNNQYHYNNSKQIEERKNDNENYNHNKTNDDSNLPNNEKSKSPAKQGNYKKQKLVKRGSICSLETNDLENNFNLDSPFHPYLIKNKSTVVENKTNSINKRCFKCFNIINHDNLISCSVCNTNYHSYCENIKSVKLVNDSSQHSSDVCSEKKICNYCIYVTLQCNTENEVKMSNNISNIINSNLDYENVDASTPIKESLIPNIKYKCQRLEDGIIKFNSQFGMNNYLFLKYSRELAKEYYLKSNKATN